MSIRITCPGCKKPMSLDEEMRGQKVRCENCDKSLFIPPASMAKGVKEAAIKNGKPKAGTFTTPSEFDEPEEPRKKKKKKKEAGSDVMTWVLFGSAALFVIGVVGVTAAVLLRKPPQLPEAEPDKPVVLAKKDEPGDTRSGTRIVIPTRNDGNPDAPKKKGGTSVSNSVRGAAWRAERRNELNQIGKYYVQFVEDYKGASRNMMNFKEYIKTAPSAIREPIEEGYYVMNFKADPTRSSQCIVAYERDEDSGQRHLAVRGDCSVDYIPTVELKAALGN